MRLRGGLALAPRRWIYLVGALAAVRAASLILLAEAIARGVATLAAGGDDMRGALVIGAAGVLLRSGATWAVAVASARAAIGTKERIRAGVARALLDGRSSAGSMATLATRGLDDVDTFFTAALPATMSVAVVPLVIGAWIMTQDWLSALILVLTVPLVPVFMVLVGQFTQERTDAAARALDRLSHHVVELARGLPTLVGLGRAAEQAVAMRQVSDSYRTTTMATLRTAFLSSLVLELIATISVAVVAVTIGIRLLGGGLELQTGLLVLILAPECYAPFRDLGAAYHASRAGRTALTRAEAIVAARPSEDGLLRRGVFGATRLSISYPDRSRPVLDSMSFILPRRGLIAVRGASGSGKSTLLAALVGRVDADARASGWVGIDPDRVGWSPQHPKTVEATVGRELELYAHGAPPHRVDELLARLGLAGMRDVDPAELSPGELRRLSVARGLLRVDAGAELLVLDEPTAHLDDRSAAAVRDLIVAAARRTCVVVASHDDLFDSFLHGQLQLGEPSALRARADAAGNVDAPVSRSSVDRDAGDPREPLKTAVLAAPGRYLAAGALGSLASAFAVALTGVSAWLIVRAAAEPAIMYLLVAIVGVRFFGLGRAVLRYLERLVTHDAVFASATALRMRLWAALEQSGPASRALQRGGTALDYLVAVTDDVRDLVPRTLLPMATGVLTGLAALVAAIALGGDLGWFTVGMLVVCLAIAPLVGLAVDRSSSAIALEERGGVLRRFVSMLEAADDLRGNGVHEVVLARLDEDDRSIGGRLRRSASSQGIATAIVVATCCTTALLVMASSSPAVASGSMPAAVAAVLVLLPIALIESFAGVVTAVQQVPALRSALARAGELDAPALAPARAGSLLQRIRTLHLLDVAGRWPGAGAAAFSGVGAVVEVGQWLVVEGPSGSGKSTLLGVLFGDLPAAAGVVLLDGLDAATLPRDELRRHVAWCPQDAHIFDSTIRANLLLGRPRDEHPDDSELWDVLRRAGLDQLILRLTDGLDTRVGSEGSRLSGGERQRLAIARTLLSRAEIVLLDEPTAHLDEQSADQLLTDLRAAFTDRIVVLVSHHPGDVAEDDARVRLGEVGVPLLRTAPVSTPA